jgi:branched-chain amino acid transport system permease protein
MKNEKSKLKTVLFLVFVAAGFLLPVGVKDPYLLHIFISIFIWSILTLGIRLILVTGHLNAAQASFMGMGAYTSGILALKLGWSFWIGLPIAGMVAALLALAIGYPTLKIKGVYFVMVTFGLTEVFRHIWMMWTGLFGGPQGLLGIPRPGAIKIGGLVLAFTTKVPFYYLAFVLMLVTIIVMRRLDSSRIGMTLRSIPQADLLAESVGVNVMGYKVLAFVIGSFFAGLAGSFWGHYFTYASPWDFTFANSVNMLIYAVMGGPSSVWGPIIGCFVMLTLDEVLRPIQQFMPIVLGAILITVLLFIPGGFITIPQRVRALWKR